MLTKLLPIMYRIDGAVLFKPHFFELRKTNAYNGGATFVSSKPVTNFVDGTMKLKYDVGTRGNGVDASFWPEDLNVEVVKA